MQLVECMFKRDDFADDALGDKLFDGNVAGDVESEDLKSNRI